MKIAHFLRLATQGRDIVILLDNKMNLNYTSSNDFDHV